jgi:hypothetical protein
MKANSYRKAKGTLFVIILFLDLIGTGEAITS